MAKSIGTLTLDLIARLGGFEQGMDRAERLTKQRTDKMRRHLKETRDSINKIGTAVGAAGAAATVGFAAMVRSTTETTDALVKMSAQLGVTAEDMQRLNFVAGRTGASSDAFGKAIQRTERQLGKVGGPIKAVQDAIGQLGLSVEDLTKLSPEEQFFTLAESLQGVEDRTKRAGLAYELFGKQGEQLAGVIATSGSDLRKIAGEFDAFNIALSQTQGKNIEALADDFHDVNTVLTSVRQRFVAELSPAISAFIDEVFLSSAKTGEFGESADEAARKFVTGFSFVLDVLDSIKRVGEIAFNAVEIGVLVVTESALRFADALINGPVAALNTLINLANKIPGVEIPLFTQTGVGDAIDDMLDFTRQRIVEKSGEILDPLEEQLLGARVLERFQESVKASAESAGKSVESSGELVEESTKKTKSAVEQTIESLQAQANELGKSGTQLELYRLASQGASDAQIQLASTLLGQIEAFNEAEELRNNFEEYQQSLLTEEELLKQSYARRLEELAAYHEAGLLSDAEYKEALQNNETEHENTLRDKKLSGLDSIERLVADYSTRETAMVVKGLKDQVSAVAQNSRKGFEIMKAVKTAETVVNTYSAAVGAYNAMAAIPIVGPALGAAAAAAAVAFGLQQVSAIQSMSYSGGGGGGGGASASVPSIGAAAGSAPQQTQDTRQNVVLNVDGGLRPDSLFSGETVLSLIDAINEAGENGARIVVSGS